MLDAFRTPGVASGGPSQHASVAICGRCGIVAPVEATTCEGCRRPLAETRTYAPYAGEDMVWVAVRATFVCRGCDFNAPLDGLDADGAVDCASCGLHQRFEVSQWTSALDFAHAVGDLAGPNPEGRAPHPTIWIGSANPHRHVGVSAAFATKGHKLKVDAGPGHPICHRCRAPVAIVAGPGRVVTTCPLCHEQATYDLASEARGVQDRLVGAVAADHRTDRPKAKSQRDAAGAIALNCPSCGAPLQIQDNDRVHTCAFCRTTCLIPPRALARGAGSEVEPETWWLLFRGPSSERAALEMPGTTDASSGAARMLMLKAKLKKDDKSRVAEVPERKGIAWDQVGLTIAIGVVALAIGYFVAGPW